ncbi:hypothetical protein HDU77_005170 [Chytriomyces hyalinus]|nr:hypothetical protein HDU77_005170 [Chytriomyces hyalinus]
MQNNNHPHPGVPDANNAEAIRAWKIQTELYRLERADNENSLRQFNYLTTVHKAEVKANSEAVSLIKRCFKDSVFRLTENFMNASEKLTAIAATFTGTHEMTMSSQWILLWNNLMLEKDASVKEIEVFVAHVAELVQEHVIMFAQEIEKKQLLLLLISKFKFYSPQQDEFKIADKTGLGFYPPLVNGQPSPTHYAQVVENFMDFLHDVVACMLSNRQMEEANAKSRNRPMAANTVNANPKLKKTKTCTIYGKCQHNTSECNKLKAQQKSSGTSKDATKDKTAKVAKSKANKTGKLWMAKQVSSDGDSAMDTTESNESPAPTGNASANTAEPVYNLSRIIHDLDVEWLLFFESNTVANKLLNGKLLALVARNVHTILDSGASK